MSYYLNENFEPMINQNYENETKFKKFISNLKEKNNKKCNNIDLEKNNLCMEIGDENIEVNSDSLYTGYCLPNTLLNTLNSNNINNKDELETLNNCSNQIGNNSIYVGFKKSIKPSLYGLKLNIKCKNGENYICPIFNELSKKIMSKCNTVNGVVTCKLDSLTNSEKED